MNNNNGEGGWLKGKKRTNKYQRVRKKGKKLKQGEAMFSYVLCV